MISDSSLIMQKMQYIFCGGFNADGRPNASFWQELGDTYQDLGCMKVFCEMSDKRRPVRGTPHADAMQDTERIASLKNSCRTAEVYITVRL